MTTRGSQSVARHGRIQPYAWLGAGAVTLGLGAAMVGGTAVAMADTGTGAGAADTSASASSAAPSAKSGSAVRKRPASRVSHTAPLSPGIGDPSPAASVHTGPSTAPAVAATASASQQAVDAQKRPAALRAAAAISRPKVGATSANSASALPAAAPPGPGVDPSYNMQSYLPTEPIVPGAHVSLAQAEIGSAQAALTQQTWGSGNVVAGVASIVPQLFLAEAALSLSAWQNNMAGASQAVAATVGIPLIHQLTQVNLLVTMTLPTLAQAGLSGAALLMPLVSLLGAVTAEAESLILQARSDGTVYAVVPVQMKAVTEPTVSVSINNGVRNSMLVDTGASGLLVTRDSAPGYLGEPVTTGEITFSGDTTQTFHYTTYLTTVDFGGGAVTGPTAVNVVDAADAAAFKEFLAPSKTVGILGVGANTYGPGPDGYNVPTTSLPGELSDGFLLYQGALFGLFGVMILGPNPLATRVSVPGAPDAYVQVSVNDGTKQTAYSIIDSGGVYGTLPAYLLNGGSSVPSGTKISVYTADGQTLLYSYTTAGSNSPTVVPDGELMNTGYTPFQQGPVYINYAAPDRIGSTDFVYW